MADDDFTPGLGDLLSQAVGDMPIRRIRPPGLDIVGGGIGGPSQARVRPANTNAKPFTPEQPSRQGVTYFLTPIQKQRLRELGFPDHTIQYTSPEQARDIIHMDDLHRAGLSITDWDKLPYGGR